MPSRKSKVATFCSIDCLLATSGPLPSSFVGFDEGKSGEGGPAGIRTYHWGLVTSGGESHGVYRAGKDDPVLLVQGEPGSRSYQWVDADGSA